MWGQLTAAPALSRGVPVGYRDSFRGKDGQAGQQNLFLRGWVPKPLLSRTNHRRLPTAYFAFSSSLGGVVVPPAAPTELR